MHALSFRPLSHTVLGIACAALLFAFAPTADAQTSTETIVDATVNLYCTMRYKGDTYSVSGSGVFIHERGVILTNAHVAQHFLLNGTTRDRVRTHCSVRTGSPAKEQYKADVLYFPVEWVRNNEDAILDARPKGTGEDDFALLYVTDVEDGEMPASFPALSLAVALDEMDGDTVTVAGYPAGRRDFMDIRNDLTYVAGTSTITSANTFAYTPRVPDLLTLSPSDAGSYGGSGGPVVDADGNVVAIITGVSANKDDPSIRAVTVPYISHALATRTAFALSTIVASDLSIRASITKLFITEEILDVIVDGFRERI